MIFGDVNTGKTALINKMTTQSEFSDQYQATIGIDLKVLRYNDNKIEYLRYIWGRKV